jgi:ribonuclease E|tara:strand:+ start:3866 stop:5527 length:1662 start_codon:yes stop_codon:yes gene_type:complete
LLPKDFTPVGNSQTTENGNPMKKEMIINVSQPEECRVAVIEDGQLEELYVERASQGNCVGNIYKGKVVNLEQGIQAVFVDFGIGRNGFLHISDVEPQYYRQGGFDPTKPIDQQNDKKQDKKKQDSRRKGRGQQRHYNGGRPRVKPPIQDIFKKGDEVLVQVIKEGIGNKGPTLSTYLSIPGRYLVLMPSLGRVGVSRKIEDDKERRKLRDILLDLEPPKGLGFIVRTAGLGKKPGDLERDLAYLIRLWKAIVRRVEKTQTPVDIYEESDIIIRTMRDTVNSDMDAIYIDEKDAYKRARVFLEMIMPKFVDRLHLYDGKQPIFHKYQLDQEIARIYKREVKLKEGGSIVIDPTEALVAIDVNSGNFRTDSNAEVSAYKMNLNAAREIARQLRLRDLGGVIVNDFIDMRQEKHRRGVERALRDAMDRDRARTKIMRTSPFGLIEMTRQRIRPSLKRSVYDDCPCCSGRGIVKTAESMAIEVVRKLMMASRKNEITRVTVRVHEGVSAYLNNKKRREIMALEETGDMVIQVLSIEGLFPEHLELDCRDAKGKQVKV